MLDTPHHLGVVSNDPAIYGATMILTGREIAAAVSCGDILIDPFDLASINPNSYNYRLSDRLRTSATMSLDAHTPVEWEETLIPPGGYELKPKRLYLGGTRECLGSRKYVTSLIGRSSIGRLGMFLTASADLSNLGPAHKWTLEINVVQPLVVYPGMRIGQVSFWKPYGDIPDYLSPYTNFDEATPPIFARVGGHDASLCDSDWTRD